MKPPILSDEEIDAFCKKVGLSSVDWDEGGGYVPESVMKVIQQAKAEVADEFSKWFEEQSWDVNGGAYIIPKIVLDRKLLMLKNPFKSKYTGSKK